MFCSKCGNKHNGEVKFCPMCGNSTEIVASSAVTENTVTQPVQGDALEQQNYNGQTSTVQPTPSPTNNQVLGNPVQQSVQQQVMQQPGQQVTPVQQISPVQPSQPMNNQTGYMASNMNVNNGYNNSPNNTYNYNNYPNYNGYNYTNPNPNQKKNKTALIIGIVILVALIILVIGMLVKGGFKKSAPRDYKEGTRTVMIYMVGSNLESENAIATSDIASIKGDEVDLENVNVLLYTGGTTKWHNFVSNNENAIYELKEDGFVKVKTYAKENMGSANTFSTFLNYAYDNYVTEHYDVIIYNHGGAIDGAVYDDFTKDRLSLNDFEEALKDSPFDEDNKLELVLFRTCLNGTIEVADVFDEYAEYLIASSEVTLGSTYTPVLGFLNDIETSDDAVSFGKKYIEEYQGQMKIIDPYSEMGQMYTIVDLSKTDKIIDLLDDFIKGIDLDSDYASVVRVRSNMFQFAYTYHNDSSYDMVDLYELVEGLSPYSDTSSSELLAAIEDAVIYNWSSIDDVHGLSIYFPYNGESAYQIYFLGLYDDFDFNEPYYAFISDFSTLKRSNKASSFGSNPISDSKITSSGNEFEIQLTDEQAKDYAKSGYIVFHKEDDGYYTPILSSNNTTLTEDGVLKTNISNNLIKVYGDEVDEYVQLIERDVNGVKTYYTASVMLSYFDKDVDMSEWHNDSASIYFKFDGDNVVVTNTILTGDDNIEGTVANLENYTTIQFWNFRYQILDENGNYTSDWESSQTYYGVEFEIDEDYKYKRSTLEDGDYYCVFIIEDIYGNTTTSRLLSID